MTKSQFVKNFLRLRNPSLAGADVRFLQPSDVVELKHMLTAAYEEWECVTRKTVGDLSLAELELAAGIATIKEVVSQPVNDIGPERKK